MLTLPLAWGLSKVLDMTWALSHNYLQPMELWLNFAQTFCFSFLLFVFGAYPRVFYRDVRHHHGGAFLPVCLVLQRGALCRDGGDNSGGLPAAGRAHGHHSSVLSPVFVAGCLRVLAAEPVACNAEQSFASRCWGKRLAHCQYTD